MRTLYIPTTTLNFNNIFSSESISPCAFYGRRGFGYKNWQKTEENPFDNSILLYEKIPMVNRPISDYDDYPLVFAVSIPEDTMEEMKEVSSGVFQYDRTVYLNPYSTTIFFATENHKRIAISKSESSAETKMFRLYQGRMIVTRPGGSVNISNLKDTELNTNAIYKDQRINRMKGMLYGYFIGAALSMNSKDVQKLNILNEIKNVFAAILASLNGRATQEQLNQLQVLFKRLERFDPKRLEIEGILADDNTSNEEKIDRIMDLFERKAYDRSKPNYYQLVKEIQTGRPEYGNNKAIVWVNQAISNLKSLSNKNKVLLHPNQGEIFLANISLTAINSALVKEGLPSELYRALINEVFSSEEFNGKISTFRLELATAATLKAKEIYGNQWGDECVARTYLNDLRRHIGGESFKQQWNAGVLSSIASVILKGDDWEKLLEFLHSKSIADYRLAFSIYGTLNGFANLTRDFTDLILDENENYVKDVYSFFHQQLHGEIIEFADLPEARIGDIDAYLYILDNLTKGKVYTVLNEKLDKNSQMPLREQVKRILPTIKGVKNDSKEKALKALEIEEKVGDPTAFCYILDNVGVSQKIREKFFKHFAIPSTSGSFQNKKKTGNPNVIPDLFSSETYKDNKFGQYTLFIEDTSWWSLTANLINEEKAKKQYLEDVKWFVENHKEFYIDKKKGKQPGRYWGEKRDNLSTINRFQRYLQNKKTSDRLWLKELYVHIDIVRIIDYLEKNYAK